MKDQERQGRSGPRQTVRNIVPDVCAYNCTGGDPTPHWHAREVEAIRTEEQAALDRVKRLLSDWNANVFEQALPAGEDGTREIPTMSISHAIREVHEALTGGTDGDRTDG